MNESPTNGELAIMINNIIENMKKHAEAQQASFDKVISAQTVANGRTKSLELWRSFLLGAWAITVIALPFILTMFWYMLSHEIDSYTKEISHEIDAKIQANNNIYFESITPTPNGQTPSGR